MEFNSKGDILAFAKKALSEGDEVFHFVPVKVRDIDIQVVNALLPLYCSVEIGLFPVEKNDSLLLDKKLYSSKAQLLNNAGLVWGFSMDYGQKKADTFRLFRDRLDFACSLYPNHIHFDQTEDPSYVPKPTAVFSSKDLDFSRGMAFACRTFYTCGRAVPWFNTVVHALKITPSSFFSDFDEWQQCNNCSFITGFVPEKEMHMTLEQMQLHFLEQKFEEKHKSHLFKAVSDIVRLNGAFSRVCEEGEESELNLSYNPDDVLSPASLDLPSFCENVTMENCTVRVFAAEEGPDYKII